MPPSIETHLSRTLSVDTQLSDLFDDQVSGFQKNFAAIREPWSIEHAEQALENLYIGLSVEDGKLSQNGRVILKSILVEEGALEDLLWALTSKSRSAKFYRRACGCLAYFIRDNEERSTRLVELGGLGCIVELMKNFPSNEVIQYYCFDLLGMLMDNANYSDRVLETAVDEIVQAMMSLRIASNKLYKKALPALISSVVRQQTTHDRMTRHIAKISHSIMHGSHDSPESAEAAVQQNMTRLLVCRDMLENLVSKD